MVFEETMRDKQRREVWYSHVEGLMHQLAFRRLGKTIAECLSSAHPPYGWPLWEPMLKLFALVGAIEIAPADHEEHRRFVFPDGSCAHFGPQYCGGYNQVYPGLYERVLEMEPNEQGVRIVQDL